MEDTPHDQAERRQLEQLERAPLAARQVQKFNDLLTRILPANTFYARKLQHLPPRIDSLDDLHHFPFTTKDELISTDVADDRARHLTYPIDHYTRFHRTSGTHGRPLVVLDTAADWQWWVRTWQFVLDAAQVTASDRALMAFSFGPFIGFWSAYDALLARGAMVIPGGGLRTEARLDLIFSSQATIVCCTPSYALHLAHVAEERQQSLADSAVRALIVAGEPGGSLPSVAQRIRSAWQADCIDHAGATEIGPWGYASADRAGLHIVESEFIAEFVRLDNQQPAAPGDIAELVLTNLGRVGAPLIRYRTGDLVRARVAHPSSTPNRFVFLEQGVLGRVDSMRTVRGVNVYPTAMDAIVREFSEIAEYRITLRQRAAMDELAIEIELTPQAPRDDVTERLGLLLQTRLGLTIPITVVPPHTLPRFEHKSQRWRDLRS